MLYCQALCCYIIEPSTSYTRRQFRPWFSINIADRRVWFRSKAGNASPRIRHHGYLENDPSNISIVLIPSFDSKETPLTRRKPARIASILGPDFTRRRVKIMKIRRIDKRSINGEMEICEWRDYGIIENWIFFFFFFLKFCSTIRSIIFL